MTICSAGFRYQQDVEEYRQEVRESLEKIAQQSAQVQRQNEAIDLAVENSTFEGLDEQVDGEFNDQLDQMEAVLVQNGMTLENYAAMYGMDEEGFKDYMRSSIEDSIKINLCASHC